MRAVFYMESRRVVHGLTYLWKRRKYMRTPQEFTKNLNNGIITTEMLNQCLYSVNKRAKNYRDEKRQYYGKYRDMAEGKEKSFYDRKEKLLSILKPVCIHKSRVGYERTRVYDYEQHFDKRCLEAMLLGKIAHTGSYLDRDNYVEVFFFDEYDFSRPKELYFLFYELGTRSYHTPINNPEKYDLPVKEIGRLETEGDDYTSLISVQFVDKVIDLIKSGNYTYKETESTVSQHYDNEDPDNTEYNRRPYELDREIENIIGPHLKRWVEKHCMEICKDEKLVCAPENFGIRQKYRRKTDAYKRPEIYVKKNASGKIRFFINDDMIEKMKEVVKQENYELDDIVQVVADTLPREVYRNYCMRALLKKTASRMQQEADRIYEKQEDNSIRLQATVDEIFETCAKECDFGKI